MADSTGVPLCSTDTPGATDTTSVRQDGGEGSASRTRKSHKSAVCLIPPEDVWDQIQAIRSVHDKVFKRWMPHINLLYPFLPDFETNFTDAEPKIRQCLTQIQPFKVAFTKQSFGYFKHKKFSTLWLRPDLTPAGDGAPEDSTTDVDGMQAGANIGAGGVQADASVGVGSVQPDTSVGVSAVQAGAVSGADDVPAVTTRGLDGEQAGTMRGADGVQASVTKGADSASSGPGGVQAGAKKGAKTIFAQPDSSHHPYVLEVQRNLELVYPQLNDLSTRSDAGFQPHLSLGQFNNREVQRAMTDLQETWTDVAFTVDHVYLISREDFDDPFHIRHAVPLGSHS